jgi:hypothetical protein
VKASRSDIEPSSSGNPYLFYAFFAANDLLSSGVQMSLPPQEQNTNPEHDDTDAGPDGNREALLILHRQFNRPDFGLMLFFRVAHPAIHQPQDAGRDQDHRENFL